MVKTLQALPWWLVHTTETCSTCSQSYAYHTEIRCLECDAPTCPICVQVTSKRELWCNECFDSADSEADLKRGVSTK
jgi:hypothetical protein